ncbi:hypothetical protein J2I47_11925 [Fibrella sp. HMF5335]|uniref:Uncharacterized protein n=1 Tax=Fibrella rubiginis TaxID=2817060 RepID=A0A939K683_9BACT|nr:hypothetical protein [Fibrella rubiginis]MBO0937255.1 hypothetical protein [Fibrella rubiginis]
MGCQKADTVTPAPDGLYKRWKAQNAEQYITFLREGIVLYGKDGTEDYCCLRTRFFQTNGNRLIFQNVPAKTLPATVQQAYCVNVSCAYYVPADWQILSLTADKLVMTNDYYKAGTYVAAP